MLPSFGICGLFCLPNDNGSTCLETVDSAFLLPLLYTMIKEIILSSMDVIVTTVNGKRGLYVFVCRFHRYFEAGFAGNFLMLIS